LALKHGKGHVIGDFRSLITCASRFYAAVSTGSLAQFHLLNFMDRRRLFQLSIAIKNAAGILILFSCLSESAKKIISEISLGKALISGIKNNSFSFYGFTFLLSYHAAAESLELHKAEVPENQTSPTGRIMA
jgi:hypothetical protein